MPPSRLLGTARAARRARRRPAHSLVAQCTAPARGQRATTTPTAGVRLVRPGDRAAQRVPHRHADAGRRRASAAHRSTRPWPAAFVAHVRHKSPGLADRDRRQRSVRRRRAGCSPTTASSPTSATACASELRRQGLTPARAAASAGDADSEVLFALVLDRLDAGAAAGRGAARVDADVGALVRRPLQRRALRRRHDASPRGGRTRCTCATTDAGPSSSPPSPRRRPGWTRGPRRSLVRSSPTDRHGRATRRHLMTDDPTDRHHRRRAHGPDRPRAPRCAPTCADGLTADAQGAAAQVVLRRPRLRAVRRDHPAARVLPDRDRAVDPARRGRRHRRGVAAPTRWSSWARAPPTRPASLLDALAAPASSTRFMPVRDQRGDAAGRRRRRSPTSYPGIDVHARRRRLRAPPRRAPPGGPPHDRVPRQHHRQLRAGRAQAVPRRPGRRPCGPATASCSAPTW